jgi:predicted O-methyltransferase YrrM
MDQLRTEPWLTEEANVILQKIIDNGKDLRIFEYGMGASTIWFLKQKNVKLLHSVEHDPEWFNYIKEEAVELSKTKETSLILADQPYHNSITNIQFDIILVDGRNRNLCIQSATRQLAPNGFIILDNSEREYYAPGKQLLEGWWKKYTHQHEPDKYGFTYPGWETTIFVKGQIPKYL